jgi:hypothetical protein
MFSKNKFRQHLKTFVYNDYKKDNLEFHISETEEPFL